MKEIAMEELLERILCSDSDELNEIISTVKERFQELWPEWELQVISVRGHTPEEHLETLKRHMAVISSCIKNDLP